MQVLRCQTSVRNEGDCWDFLHRGVVGGGGGGGELVCGRSAKNHLYSF